ncbi:MAG: hypothetical protein P9M06_06215, partial [Candidatus Saelkia tenebricola]|nr:hypothetical protein [Candidatus Saelkia tenebricola]
MSRKSVIIAVFLAILSIDSTALARRVKNEDSRADYSHLLTVLIDTRKLFSDYETDIDGQNL